ncbi:PLP-dependent transferase [Caniella muris]|uniref:PLP-dependent transferase n=1 Tax=Caniella muris TaxID=2941502 RepID=UPI00203CDBD7|nr:PLP-dependent transferase [Caniella muris]
MTAPADKPAAPGDPAAALTGMLGARCARTWLVAATPSEAAAALGVPCAPVVSCALGAPGLPAFSVRDLRAEKAARPRGALLGCDVSATGPYLCPAAMRGADVVVDDLSSLGLGPAAAPVCALSLSRDALRDAAAVSAAERLAASRPMAPAAVRALSAALQGFPKRCRRRADAASAMASYLACHPDVAATAYPGLKGDPTHGTAERVLENGFGFSVAFAPAPSPAAVLAGSGALEPAARARRDAPAAPDAPLPSPTTLAPLPSGPGALQALLLTVGDADPLALVMWLERLLDPFGEF